MLTTETHERIQTEARRWVDTPYYNAVEKGAGVQWTTLLDPFFAGHPVDFTTTVELAIGHGRMTQGFFDRGAQEVVGIDILQENIDFCRTRFVDEPRVRLVKNDGATLPTVADNSASFIFCFDSMVHFDSDIVRAYLGEFRRALKPGGYSFCHHSNRHRDPTDDWQRAPHARNFMSAEFFAHYVQKEGLKTVKQEVIDWGRNERRFEKLDCLSLMVKEQAPDIQNS